MIEVTDGHTARYRGSFFYDIAKATVIRLAQAQAAELAPHGVTAVALTPGFLRSEAMLDHFGVTDGHAGATAQPTRTSPSPRRRPTSAAPSWRSPPTRTCHATPAARWPPARSPASTASPTPTARSRTSRPTGRASSSAEFGPLGDPL